MPSIYARTARSRLIMMSRIANQPVAFLRTRLTALTAYSVLAFLMASLALSSNSSADDGSNPPRLAGYRSQYTLLEPLRTARLTPIETSNGEVIDLGQFRGKVVLLNFWATWCAPCVYEMPSLNQLAREMADTPFVVVPVSLNSDGHEAVAAFYRSRDLDHLGLYFDSKQRTAYAFTKNPNGAEFALYGLPITYIVDHRGRPRGYITGAVNWQSDAAKNLIRYYIEHIED